jgi:hypothetical protein
MRPSLTLAKVGACENAIKWARSYSTHQAAWTACERADWLMWYLGKLVDLGRFDRNRLVLLACQCARTALPYVMAGESRPLQAIETAEAWARGDAGVTLADVIAAAHAADAAAHAAYAAAHAATHAAAYAAHAAAHSAAHAAHAATHAAAHSATHAAAHSATHAATYAAHAAAYATAYATAYAVERTKAHQKMCDMIRADVRHFRAVKENENG